MQLTGKYQDGSLIDVLVVVVVELVLQLETGVEGKGTAAEGEAGLTHWGLEEGVACH
jgi:hypothetical protein